MITCYFGVPGVGKTTIAARIAQKELKRIRKGKSQYDYVLTNFECRGCHKVDFHDIGRKDIQNCLIIFDEITLDADNRDHKNFAKESVEGFVLHRHYFNDIIVITQYYQMMDIKIRNLTQRLYIMTKSYILPISRYRQVFRTYVINEHTSELVMGYRFANFVEILLSLLPFNMSFGKIAGLVWRPKWYKYYDSYSQPLKLDPFKYQSWDEVLPEPDVVLNSEVINIS